MGRRIIREGVRSLECTEVKHSVDRKLYNKYNNTVMCRNVRTLITALTLLAVICGGFILVGCEALGLTGPAGPAGPVGETGPAGPPGADGTDTTGGQVGTLVWESDFAGGITQFYSFGSPAPFVDNSGGGRSNVLDPNGDATFRSGLILEEPASTVTIQPGTAMRVDYWINTTTAIHNVITFGLIQTNYTRTTTEPSGTRVTVSRIAPNSATRHELIDVNSSHTITSLLTESNGDYFVTADNGKWHSVLLKIVSDTQFEVHHNNQLIYTGDLPANSLGVRAYPIISGRSNAGNDLILIDNVRVYSR